MAPHDLRMRVTQDERGATLVIVVLWLPLLILFVAFVVDVGHWFEHRRQAQLAADAGALAAGSSFFFPCTDGPILALARQYAGDPNVAGSYNRQVAPTQPSNMHVLLNSTSFYNEGGSDLSDGTPCAKNYIDVKITESDLPWYFRAAQVRAINAHARVSIMAAGAVSGQHPIGVRDPNVNSAAVLFVNDATKEILDAEALVKQPGGAPGTGYAVWTNTTAADVAVARHTVAVIALSGVQAASLPIPAPGTSAITYCAQDFVECMQSTDTGLGTGIVYVRGYPTSPAARDDSPPELRGVWLAPGGNSGSRCNSLAVDSWFSWFQTKRKSSCEVGVRAEIDFGGRNINSDIKDVTVTGGNCTNCALSKPTGSGTTWDRDVAIPAETGPNPMTIEWAIKSGTVNGTTCTNSSPCTGSFGVAQQYFAGNDVDSGPIRAARVWDYTNYDGTPGSIAGGINAFPLGSTRRLVAEVHLGGSIAQSVDDAPIAFRIVGGNLTGSIDCDPGMPTLREEMTTGCNPAYEKNQQLAQADPCNPPYGNKNDLYSSDQPWDCVVVATGGTVGQFTDGIQGRIFNNGVVCTGGTCPSSCPADSTSFVPGRNYWDSRSTSTDNLYKDVGWGDSGFLGWNRNDPRIIGVFMVPFSAFRVSSDRLYPVVNFGTFYVTGWLGNNATQDDPCPGADQPTGPARSRLSGGVLYGHFINYVTPSNVGGGNGTCDLSSFTPCVAVLTD
jgi:hypothetical protein